MLWKLKYAVISFLLGFSLLGLNLQLQADGASSFMGIFAAVMLIFMGLMDFIEYLYERGKLDGKNS